MSNSANIQTLSNSTNSFDCGQAIHLKPEAYSQAVVVQPVVVRSTIVRSALAARLWKAAELQAEEIENRLAMGARSAAEAEKDARVLSILAKTLRDLSSVDDANCGSDEHDEDTASDDLETLREELGKRLKRIHQERAVKSLDN